MEDILHKSAYELMSMGGDHRITIDENIGFNIYGCKPFPAYSIAYSSSTGSNISLPAYGYIKAYWEKLKSEIMGNPSQRKEILKREYGMVRQKMRDFYKLDPSVDFVFGPSGTDVEYIALALTDKKSEKGVHNIVLGADEVGSGIENAAQGRYFSELTPSGQKVNKGEVIQGFIPNRLSVTFINIRNEEGEVIEDDQLLVDIKKEIDAALAQSKRPLVHIIHSSKTGLVLPEWDALLRLQNNYGNKIDVIVDACQARISIYSINRYLSIGAMVLLTGSKFLSGPPFSGALLLPKFVAERIQSIEDLPVGFSTLFGESEFPQKWTRKTSNLYNIENFGLLLRWKAAIYEMNKIFRIPDLRLKYVIDAFRENVLSMIENTSFLSLVKNNRIEDVPEYVYDRSPFEKNTIFTVLINHPDGPVNKEETKKIHKALYSDVTRIISSLDKEDIAKLVVQLGQPVKTSEINERKNTTLRIAISARQISEMALLDNDVIATIFKSDMMFIKEKLDVVLRNFKSL